MCNQWDLFSTRGLEWEMNENCSRRAPSTWLVMCRCQAKQGDHHLQSAHRACAEKKLLLASDSAMSDVTRGCAVCSTRLVEDTRLPTISELVSLTWEDIWAFRQDFGGGFFVVVPSCSAVLTTTLRSFGWESRALYAWVALAVSICFVAHSPWFDQRLRRLGNEESASFLAYQRLYHALVLSSLAHVFLCSPYTSVFDQERSTIIRAVANASFYANFAFLLVVGGATLAVYWRAHYPVKTLREDPAHDTVNRETESTPESAETAAERAAQSCILCQLLVCNDE